MTPNRSGTKPARAGDTILVPAVIVPADSGYVYDTPIDLTAPGDGQPIPYTGDPNRDIKPVEPPDYILGNPSIPVKRTTTYYASDGGNLPTKGATVVPVVLTTTSVDPPLPTLPAPLVPVTPTNNPYYVPGAVAPAATPAMQPPSPDPGSNIVNGTPIQTPNLPATTTSLALNVPAATETVNIMGMQVSKTAAIVGVLAIVFLLMNKK